MGVDASAVGGARAIGGAGTSTGGRAAAGAGGGRQGAAGSGGAPNTGGRTGGNGGAGGSKLDAGATDASRECRPLDAQLPDAAPSSFCRAAAAAACGAAFDEAACEASIGGQLARVPACCREELVALFACAGRYGMRCATLSDDVLFAPECAGVEEQWDLCAGSGDNCTEVLSPAASDAGAACRIECDQYAADCVVRATDDVSCMCTYGPRRGRTFSPGACDPTAIAAGCK